MSNRALLAVTVVALLLGVACILKVARLLSEL